MRYHFIDISFFFACSYSRQHPYLLVYRLIYNGDDVVGVPDDGGIPGISTTYAESKTNGCRAQRTTRTDGGREWSATGSFHRNLESRPRLASRKATIIAS